MTYQPKFATRSRFLTIRGLNYHVREWGDPALPKLVILHGWMDVSASFQFMADQLADRFHLLAPDWRGHGLSQWVSADTYWFQDYLADLDVLLDSLVGDVPVPVVGHSMGGNILMMYGGIRSQRLTHLINLEGFGLGGHAPEKAPQRCADWLDLLKSPAAMRPYASLAEVAARLIKNNPRLSAEKAEFLAPHWAAFDGEKWQIQADPIHLRYSPQLYRVDEILCR